ncbi:deoxynucleotidyltransferase terminal-interacting protein 1-like [Paramacrobiotus metropolitanus]|uniref:deoxynucleotidyltransferase terminal-interacting protein 1-like n=1 Tax=Paramacrobiotus metropolitanus TaxID=2943436 RepID=UPI002445F5D4|nr:deoxynucleotidyltransferase terminal-interacting protein 1-like [Paramacrobiotus metropolitanus]
MTHANAAMVAEKSSGSRDNNSNALKAAERRQGFLERPFWPYNERTSNSVNASIAAAVSGRTSRSHAAVSSTLYRGMKHHGSQPSALKSLDAVRVVIQKYINQDFDAILQKYAKDYLEPAIKNLRNDSGHEAVSDNLLNLALCKILDEAKKMYEPAPPPPPPVVITPAVVRSTSPYSNISEAEVLQEPFARYGNRRESDGGDSYSSGGSSAKRLKTEQPKRPRGAPRKNPQPEGILKTFKSTVDLFNLPQDTKFMLGSSANKVLGFESARGRIYAKHPDLFKYAGDSEDKVWFFENKIMTAAGGKAFLVIAEDIREILRQDTSVPRGKLAGAKEFTIPGFILDKVRAKAERHATAIAENRPRSVSSLSSGISGSSPAPVSENDPEPEEESISPVSIKSEGYEQNPSVMRNRNFPTQESPSDNVFYSPIMSDEVFSDGNDVFVGDGQSFSAGSSLDPSAGTMPGHHFNGLAPMGF